MCLQLCQYCCNTTVCLKVWFILDSKLIYGRDLTCLNLTLFPCRLHVSEVFCSVPKDFGVVLYYVFSSLCMQSYKVLLTLLFMRYYRGNSILFTSLLSVCLRSISPYKRLSNQPISSKFNASYNKDIHCAGS